MHDHARLHSSRYPSVSEKSYQIKNCIRIFKRIAQPIRRTYSNPKKRIDVSPSSGKRRQGPVPKEASQLDDINRVLHT
jgi:hypothetical protein